MSNLEPKLTAILKKYDEMQARLMAADLPTAEMIATNKELSSMNEIVDLAKEYLAIY